MRNEFVVLLFTLPRMVLTQSQDHEEGGTVELCPTVCTCLGSHVDCSRRNLQTLPQNLPSWAETIELQGNRLVNISSGAFDNLPLLVNLDLSDNSMQFLDTLAFEGAPRLETLQLQKNSLRSLPSRLGRLAAVRQLNLRANSIQRVPSTLLASLPNIEKLDLSRNGLTQWPEQALPASGAASSIRLLYLDGNRLRFLPNGTFHNLPNLRELRLGRNRLRLIHKDSFRNMPSLALLDLSRNRLKSIGGLTFRYLSGLATLRLGRNELDSLEDGAFWGLTDLKDLRLKNNKLTSITQGALYGLDALLKLDLSRNEISRLDEELWKHSRKLQILNLAGNQLVELPAGQLRLLADLKELNLETNRISRITQESFDGLDRLQVLNLRGNELRTVIEDSVRPFAAGLGALENLNLAANELHSLPRRAFGGLRNLRLLDLLDNPFGTLHRDAFAALDRLEQLYLNSSSLLCDCQLDWLSQFLLDRKLDTHVDRLVCAHPPQLLSVSLFDLPPANLTCGDSPKPRIVVQPESVAGLRGQNATFQCSASASGDAPIIVEWKRRSPAATETLYAEEGLLEMSKWVESKESGGVLFTSRLDLFGLNKDDVADYQCVVSNQFGAAYSQKASLAVHVLPQMTRRPADVALEAGGTARLECAASGWPEPELRWTKDGGEQFAAAVDRRMHVMPTDDVFFIVNVKPVDAGLYACHAANAAGQASASLRLDVLERPRFRKQPLPNRTVHAGETAVLECLADGSPPPTARWFFKGEQLRAGSSARYSFTSGSMLLVIVRARPSDAGAYECEVSNRLATRRLSLHLSVIGDLSTAKFGNGSAIGGRLDDYDGDERPPGDGDDDAHWLLPFDPASTLGAGLIVVVCCIVCTSLVWVCVIWCHRRRRNRRRRARADDAAGDKPPSYLVVARDELPVVRAASLERAQRRPRHARPVALAAAADNGHVDRLLAFASAANARRPPPPLSDYSLPDDDDDDYVDGERVAPRRPTAESPAGVEQTTSSLDSGVGGDTSVCPLLSPPAVMSASAPCFERRGVAEAPAEPQLTGSWAPSTAERRGRRRAPSPAERQLSTFGRPLAASPDRRVVDHLV